MEGIKAEDIRGYVIEGRVVCLNCITAEEEKRISLDEIITQNDGKRQEHCCNRCKEYLKFIWEK